MTPRVLIVDDDPIVLQLLQHSLPEGAVSRTARSSFKALQSMEAVHPDVILLDIDMPGMSGLEVLDVIRGDSRWDYVRVVVVSGKVAEASRLEAYEHGADDFLGKPFLPEEIRYKVENWTRFSRAIELSQLKSEFFTVVSDDDQSPFVPVVTATQVLRQIPGITDFDRIMDAIEAMEGNSESFLKHLNMVQEYFEWHAGKRQASRYPFALDSLLDPLLAQWEGICRDRSVQLVVADLPPNLMVSCESKSLKRVIRWVFHNAVRCAATRVTVNAGRAEDGFAFLDICDDGPGFAPERLPLVFAGFRVGNRFLVDTRMGLHLSLGQEILNAQGGAISIVNPGPDATTVRLSVPS